MRDEIIETVREVFYASGKPVEEESLIEELAMDSMDVVELIAVLTNRYRISMKAHEMSGIRTVRDIVDFVIKKRTGAPSEGFF